MRCGLLAFVLCAPAYAIPVDVPVQGRLVDALGEPITGDHALELSIFTQATGGTLIHRETFTAVALQDG